MGRRACAPAPHLAMAPRRRAGKGGGGGHSQRSAQRDAALRRRRAPARAPPLPAVDEAALDDALEGEGLDEAQEFLRENAAYAAFLSGGDFAPGGGGEEGGEEARQRQRKAERAAAAAAGNAGTRAPARLLFPRPACRAPRHAAAVHAIGERRGCREGLRVEAQANAHANAGKRRQTQANAMGLSFGAPRSLGTPHTLRGVGRGPGALVSSESRAPRDPAQRSGSPGVWSRLCRGVAAGRGRVCTL